LADLTKLLSLGFVAPMLLKIADGRQLHPYQRTALKVVGWSTIAVNLHKVMTDYYAGKYNGTA